MVGRVHIDKPMRYPKNQMDIGNEKRMILRAIRKKYLAGLVEELISPQAKQL